MRLAIRVTPFNGSYCHNDQLNYRRNYFPNGPDVSNDLGGDYGVEAKSPAFYGGSCGVSAEHAQGGNIMSPFNRQSTGAGSARIGGCPLGDSPQRKSNARRFSREKRRERGGSIKRGDAAWHRRLQNFYWALILFLKDVQQQRNAAEEKITELEKKLESAEKLLAIVGYGVEGRRGALEEGGVQGEKGDGGEKEEARPVSSSGCPAVVPVDGAEINNSSSESKDFRTSISEQDKAETGASTKNGDPGSSPEGYPPVSTRRSSLQVSLTISKGITLADDAPCSCRRCRKVFPNRGYCEQHFQATHEAFRFQCDRCSKQVPFWSQLNRHMVAVHGCQVKRPCGYCGEQFDTLKEFEQHNRHDHGMGRVQLLYLCPLCDTQAPSKAGLRKHWEDVHDGSTGLPKDATTPT